ncbi:hypothetical protein PR048_018465 [Dryococelus australis]|uniref:Uncharacterized protein n=1 Tax=Dryococelus australis TaxID=614101 RepID=A0ABQ9HCJ5_9NEOP|nr:hypothetical protein PR048_018465 [Dryococelus australis]
MGEERRKLLKPEALPNKNLLNRNETVDVKRKLVDELITTKPKQLRSSDNETVSQEKYQISEIESITANTEAAPPLNFKPDLHFQKEIDLLKLGKAYSYLREKVGIPLPGLSTMEMDEKCEIRFRSPRRSLDCSARKVTNNDSF